MKYTLVAIGLTLPIIAAVHVAGVLARRAAARSGAAIADHTQFNVIQAAILALLGLLLGFGFSGAMSRYVERQDILVREANAISTSYLRAGLLADEPRDALRTSLREYATHRLELFRTVDDAAVAPARQRLADAQARVWAVALAVAKDQPGLTMPLLIPINEMFDLLAVRNAANRRHIPVPIFVVIYACALTGAFVVGSGLTRADRRVTFAAGCLAALIAATVWITVDLDFPRAGLVRISDQPLVDALQSMTP